MLAYAEQRQRERELKKAGNIYCLELASNERYANEIV